MLIKKVLKKVAQQCTLALSRQEMFFCHCWGDSQCPCSITGTYPSSKSIRLHNKCLNFRENLHQIAKPYMKIHTFTTTRSKFYPIKYGRLHGSNNVIILINNKVNTLEKIQGMDLKYEFVSMLHTIEGRFII